MRIRRAKFTPDVLSFQIAYGSLRQGCRNLLYRQFTKIKTFSFSAFRAVSLFLAFSELPAITCCSLSSASIGINIMVNISDARLIALHGLATGVMATVAF